MGDYLLEETLRAYIQRKKLSNTRVESASNRRFRPRKSWRKFQFNMTDPQFRRYFRMSRECFAFLCKKIKTNVGEDEFMSEEYLRANSPGVSGESHGFFSKMHMAASHKASTGGFISGEIKLVLTL